MQEYETIRQELTARYETIQSRLQKISREVQHQNEPLSADFAEQVVQRENDEVLDALDSSIRTEMDQIQATLKRLDDGEYGVCAGCGKPIPIKRLEALPHASRCVACAEKAQ